MRPAAAPLLTAPPPMTPTDALREKSLAADNVSTFSFPFIVSSCCCSSWMRCALESVAVACACEKSVEPTLTPNNPGAAKDERKSKLRRRDVDMDGTIGSEEFDESV